MLRHWLGGLSGRDKTQPRGGRAPEAAPRPLPVPGVAASPTELRVPYQPGDVIGQKYEVHSILGKGGFGIVYLVYHTEHHSAYAFKTFRDEFLDDDPKRQLFRREASVWVALERHPYLLRAYFVDEVSGRLYIATEYVAPDELGLNSLKGYLQERPPDLAQSLKWAIQACHGMEYAYSRGVRCHRDIKPDNIMIGQDQTVRISDFGLAGAVRAAQTADSGYQGEGTAWGESLQGVTGTPPYMPPEQFVDVALCDERSDVYSFGVVLYQMATGGRLPFVAAPARDRSPAERQRYLGDWRDLHARSPVPMADSPLYPLIERCLAKEPVRRYQRFAELRAELESLLLRHTGESVVVPQRQELAAWELVNKGASLNALGRYQEAVRCYGAAIAQAPGLAAAWNNKGVSLNGLGQHEQAVRSFEEAIRLQPRYAAAWAGKGLSLARQGRHGDAIACFERAASYDPGHAGAWNSWGASLEALGRHDEAITCLDRAIELDAGYVDAWYNKGTSLTAAGHVEAALACFATAAGLDPRAVAALVGAGACLLALGRHEEALAYHDRAIALDPRHAGAWNNKGLSLSALGKDADAMACFDEAIGLDRRYAAAWSNKGASLSALGRYLEAVGCYDKALAIDRQSAAAWHGKGDGLSAMGRHKDAIACYAEAVRLYPGDVDALVNQGACYEAMGRHREAIGCFDQAIRIDEGLADAWHNKGVSLKGLGHATEALECFDRAISLSPEAPRSWTNRGVILLRLRRYEEANACFEEVLRRQPEHASSWNNKALCAEALGRREEAARCYRQFIALAGDGFPDLVARARDRLREL